MTPQQTALFVDHDKAGDFTITSFKRGDAIHDEPDLALHGARATDPDTSHAAARRDPIRRGTDRHSALATLADHGPLTDFELAALIDRQQTSAGKRRGELVQLGYVEATTARRPAPSGSLAIVWRITAAGSARLGGAQ